jgi:hypothetical protein
MNTFEITKSALEGYKNEKLGDFRIDALIIQASKQIDEISQDKALYNTFLAEVNAPLKIDKTILWILLMSNEDICCDYINAFKKEFRKIIPISDLSDLLVYSIYLKKVKNITLEGFDDLLEYEEDGMEELDQYSFTNVFLYIQKLKEVSISF